MANSYNQTYVHFIFSTKKRKPLIKPDFEKRLSSYIAGIGKQNGFHVITSGGMPDHAHILLELSKTKTISQTIQKIKGSSSKWINDEFYPNREFSWQNSNQLEEQETEPADYPIELITPAEAQQEPNSGAMNLTTKTNF